MGKIGGNDEATEAVVVAAAANGNVFCLLLIIHSLHNIYRVLGLVKA